MPKRSAGILMYRRQANGTEVFLVHPGGPFWAKKDLGAWSVPKGEYLPGEDPLTVARREFQEETGLEVSGDFLPLGEEKQPAGKLVSVWAVQGDCSPAGLRSNTFQMEWPPRSGRTVEFPEVDRWEWFSLNEARKRILPGQKVFLEKLAETLR
ncbi:MAG TPA: NUDIX domain-containing protein [Pseudacidobacterium sp.]|nr:NUDIX domain-containing protein [Pseudacidobacterium sp.]